MSRIIKSKFYKPFIALLVAVILVFSFEVNKPKAIAPILAWGAWAIGGIVAEELVEMGIRHYTADGKIATKSKTKKIADEIFSEYGAYGFDFLNTNPKRKADGSLEMYPSANDRAKIARKIADEFADVIEESNIRKTSNQTAGVVFVADSSHVNDQQAYDFAMTFFDIEKVETSSSRNDYYFYSIVTGKQVANFSTNLNYTNHRLQIHSYNELLSNNNGCWRGAYYDSSVTYQQYMVQANCDLIDIDVYKAYKGVKSFGANVFYGQGLSVPSTLENVYPAPKNMSPTYKLPNYDDLSNKPTVIKNVYPVSQSDDDTYTWETVNNDYETDNSIINKMEQNVDTYLENGDYVKNQYNTQTVNNYYTDSNYPVKSGDVTVIVDVDVPPPVVIDDDDDTSGTTPPPAEVLDRTLLSYAKQTYDYLGDSIDGAIRSMRDITDDASGLVDYLDTSFRWLPAEWRALFGSAFILGVFAHFMRR